MFTTAFAVSGLSDVEDAGSGGCGMTIIAAGTATPRTLALSMLSTGAVEGYPIDEETIGRDGVGGVGQQGRIDAGDNDGDDADAEAAAILTGVYERYATLYPNPDLANEVAERERILRAVRAAASAASSAATYERQGSVGAQGDRAKPPLPWRWWGRLFPKRQQQDQEQVDRVGAGDVDDERKVLEYYSDSSDDDDEELDYVDDNASPLGDDDGEPPGRRPASLRRHLLGTQWSLDASCIPEEAVSYARFQLACGARQGRKQQRGQRHVLANATHGVGGGGGGGGGGAGGGSSWNVARTTMTMASATNMATKDESTVAIVGLGRLLVYSNEDHTWTHQSTSDMDDLVRYWDHRRQHQLQHGFLEAWGPSHARSAFFPPNVLAVAWGIPGDPVVILYMRTGRGQQSVADFEWEARAVIKPCDAVQASSGSVFDDPDGLDNDDGWDHGEAHDNRLLTISGIVPLAAPGSPDPTSFPAASVNLAIGRLGGTIELVAVPLEAMQRGGSAKPPASAKRRSTTKRHHAHGVVDLLALKDLPSTVVALTTSQWHDDIVCLDAISVPANSSSTAASAHCVLVATGRKNHDFRGEALSFWNVTVTMPLESQEPFPARLDATMLAALDIGELGPDFTLFASPILYRHWRRPLRVRLRQGDGVRLRPGDGVGVDSTMTSDSSRESTAPRVTTISTPAPVTLIRSHSSESHCFVSILDSNGGVQVIDCCNLVRRLRQIDSPHEFSMTELDLPTLLMDRIHVLQALAVQRQGDERLHSGVLSSPASTLPPATVTDLGWYSQGSSRESPQLLALCLSRPRRLALLSLPSDAGEGVHSSFPPVVLPSQSSVCAMKADRDGALVILCRPEADEDEYTSFALRGIDPLSLVGSLVQQSKYTEAIDAAHSLSISDQVSVRDLVETSKVREWRRTLDPRVLDSIQDAKLVVAEVLSFNPKAVESAVGPARTIQQFRDCLYVALQRSVACGCDLDPVRLRETLVRLGTYELLCQHFSIEPSLHAYSEEFAHVGVADLASSLAQRLDFVGLSILHFRHWNEFYASFDSILSRIPVSVDPFIYHHLLPTTAPGKFVRFDGSDFGLGDRESLCALPLAHAPYVMPVVLDNDDCRLTLDCFDANPIDKDSVRDWYKDRLLRIASKTRSVALTRTFASYGRAAMNDSSQTNLAFESNTLVDEYWRGVIRRSDALPFLFREGPTKESGDGTSIYDVEVHGTGAVDLQPLVREVIRCLVDPGRSRELYFRVLAPFIELQAEVQTQDDVDTTFGRCCIDMLNEATAAGRKSNTDLRAAIRQCSLVFHLSRTSLSLNDRWIKSISVLAEVTHSAIDAAVTAFQSNPPEEVGRLLEDCWRLYESLPVQADAHCADVACLKDVAFIADHFFEHLVVFDVLGRWPCASMVPVQSDAGTHAQEILVALCKALASRISLIDGDDSERQVKIALATFASNLSALNRLSRFDSVDMDHIATTTFMKVLIKSSKVDIAARVMSTPGNEWLDRNIVRESVLSVLDKCYANERDCDAAGQMPSVASSCSDIISRFFPDTALRIEESQQLLKGLDFLHSVLLKGRSSRVYAGATLRHGPLDIIAMVLSEHLELVTFGCDQWNDPRDSVRAGVHPSDAVLHLGMLLGLRSESDQVAVTSLIVSHCLSAGLSGLAAFVCLRCISNVSVWNVDHLAIEVLRMASRIVANDDYNNDVGAKGDLCTVCLRSSREFGKRTGVASLDHLIWGLAKSEWRRHVAMNRIHHRLFVGNRLCADTDTAYSGTDLTAMYQSLQAQSAAASVDGSLLITLSKLVYYWSISQFTQEKAYVWQEVERIHAQAVVSMAASLLLHCPDSLASFRALHEVKSILIEQERVASSSSLGADSRSVATNADVVRRLKDRGYSDLGARRALMMSGSNSFEDALQWAVLHCLDDDFEKPFITVQPQSPRSVEWKCVAYLKDVIAASETFLTSAATDCLGETGGVTIRDDEPAPRSNGVELSLEADHPSDGNVHLPSATTEEANSRRGSASSTAPGERGAPASHPPQDVLSFPSTVISHCSGSGSRLEGSPDEVSLDATALRESEAKTPTAEVGDLATQPTEDVPPMQAAVKATNQKLRSPIEPTVTEAPQDRFASAESGIPPPKVSHMKRTLRSEPRAESAAEGQKSRDIISAQPKSSQGSAVSRSSLRLRGRAALDVARSRGSPASEERRRLIEAGRELLKSAATRRGSSIPTPTATATGPARSRGYGVERPAREVVDNETRNCSIATQNAARVPRTQLEPGAPVNVGAIEDEWFDEQTDEPLDASPSSEALARSEVVADDVGPSLEGAAAVTPGNGTTNDWDFDDPDVDLT